MPPLEAIKAGTAATACYNPPTMDHTITQSTIGAGTDALRPRPKDAVATITASGVAFSTAESMSRWLKSLPLTNVNEVTAALLTQLRAMSVAQFAPRERATIAELLREQVAYLHTELARRYAGKPQPAAGRELEAVEQAIALWQGLWEQYSACLKPMLEGDADLEGVKPKVLQRGLYVGKQLVLVHGLARRTPPPALWEEIHAYYRLAEMLECAGTSVSDELMPNAVGISCYSTFSHALLLGLADPCAMNVKQIELADRWLQMWARKVFPYPKQRESDGPVLVIDLNSGVGAALVAGAPRHVVETMRFGYTTKLANSVRGRLKRLQTGAEPAELQLGHDCSSEQCTTLLAHLDAKWYQHPRRPPPMPDSSVSLCAGGVPGAFFRVAGRTFHRTDPMGRLTFQGALHLQTLGAVADYDRGREEAERDWVWERWEGAFEYREASLARAGAGSHRWSLEQLAVMRTEDRLRIGYVTRVAQDDDGGLGLSLRIFSGAPTPISVRPVSTMQSEDPPIPCLMLGETPDDKSCLILPSRTYGPSRVLRSLDAGPERRLRLTRLLQRGVDFERVAFDEA